MFKKILIANRGEIAVRVIRACREMGIETVAVYSGVDSTALHVQLAAQAVLIGPPPPLESYLNIDKIIETAKDTGAEAIHPGYGFLAENPDFAERCEKERLIFIGPTSKALRLVGDKVASRNTMQEAKIPVIPGMMVKGGDLKEFQREAERIGYPVLLKASAGGGGKGMRVVRSAEELKGAVEAGRREAKASFGDESVYLEKFLEEPRHVEFQILADNFGEVVHLFERECSIQRRHQKIIEETPSPALDDALRHRMGETALKAIKASGYTNAGTVEFLLDPDKNFYFLEVNARIQVEHPITEMVVGVDLVKQQIRLAAGERITLKQESLSQRGHAIECRIYAEDPGQGFLPAPGKILFLHEPRGPGIRHDSGVFSGYEVPVHYDPILSKLIAWAEDRESVRRRMVHALEDLVILGIKTTVPFLRDLITHPAFQAGNTNTRFIEEYFSDWTGDEKGGDGERIALMAAAVDAFEGVSRRGRIPVGVKTPTPWQSVGKWEILRDARIK